MLALIDGRMSKKVHVFEKSSNQFGGSIALVGNFLAAYDAKTNGEETDVEIWRLPANFIETCHRRLEEGTVGISLHCDQIVGEHAERPDHYPFYTRVDHFGVFNTNSPS